MDLIKNQKKILFVAPRFHSNQIAICKVLKKNNYKLLYYVNKKYKNISLPFVKQIKFKPSKISRIFQKHNSFKTNDDSFIFPKISCILKIFKKENPSICIIRNPKRIVSLFAMIICQLRGVKTLFYIQRSHSEKKFLITEICEAFFCKILGAKVYSPVFTKKKWPYHINFLPFLVQIQKKIREKLTQSNLIKILVVGKYSSYRKNHELILSLLANNKKFRKAFFVTICGQTINYKGYKHFLKLKKYIVKKKLSKNVSVFKDVSWKKMRFIYNHNDIYLQPAFNEPASISLLEAMSAGCFPVASENGGSNCYLGTEGKKFIFSPQDPQNLSNVLNRIRKDKNKIIRICKESQRQIKKICNEEKWINSFNKMVRK